MPLINLVGGAISVFNVRKLTIQKCQKLAGPPTIPKKFLKHPVHSSRWPFARAIVRLLLERAVRSVLPQMNGYAELLIVDNASTDDTPTVAAQLAAANPRVKVVRVEELGISLARNAALKMACGQFVLFFDDDETAEPDWLATYQRFWPRRLRKKSRWLVERC